MSRQSLKNDAPSEFEQVAMAEELLSNQLALMENVSHTSHLLKTTLTAVKANLGVIQAQLIRIQELAAAMDTAPRSEGA